MADSERIIYLKNELQHRILILDGAMGSLLQTYRLTEEDFRGDQFVDHPCELKGYNDLLSITQPHIVREIHANYCSAGADIIETNTFTSTSVSMADYQLQDIAYQVNYEAARIAREVADKWTSPEQTALRCWQHGTHESELHHLAERKRPRLSKYHVLTTRFRLYHPSRGFNQRRC